VIGRETGEAHRGLVDDLLVAQRQAQALGQHVVDRLAVKLQEAVPLLVEGDGDHLSRRALGLAALRRGGEPLAQRRPRGEEGARRPPVLVERAREPRRAPGLHLLLGEAGSLEDPRRGQHSPGQNMS
jgi:hypothetical protein